jgi:hypothetical protein
MVKSFLALERGDFKVRSRALTNTLFARLFVADLFIHGIGGAKYDELTDEIIRRYYGCDPPSYMVLSATLRLPFQTFPATREKHRLLAAKLRDLRYNPQKYLPEEAAADRTVRGVLEQRQLWISRRPENARERRERFEMLRKVNALLNGYASQEMEQVHRDVSRCETELQANAVLTRRDYVFCLFPEAILRSFCTQFLQRDGTGGFPPAETRQDSPAR